MTKIISYSIIPVLVPTIYHCLSSVGNCSYTVRTLLNITTSSGLGRFFIGWGETYGDYCIDNTKDLMSKLYNLDKLPSSTNFQNKYEIKHKDYGILQMNANLNNQAVLFIKMALLDIEAQQNNLPLYKYLCPESG